MSLPAQVPKGAAINAQHIHPRVLAHLGDAAYELRVRKKALEAGHTQLDAVHRYCTARVNGEFQARLLQTLKVFLTDMEQDLVRRGRNLPVTAKKRSDHAIHRQASGFEALIGFLYLEDPTRLDALWQEILPYIDHPEQLPSA